MDSRRELLRIISGIYHIANVRHNIIRTFCDNQWLKNLKTLSEKTLIRKLRFIISLCSLRTILYIYKRGILNNKKSICILAKNFTELDRFYNNDDGDDVLFENITYGMISDVFYFIF